MSDKSLLQSRREFLKKAALGSLVLVGGDELFSKGHQLKGKATETIPSQGWQKQESSKRSPLSVSKQISQIHSSSIIINHACPFVNPAMTDKYIAKLQKGGITVAMSTVASNDTFRSALGQIMAFYERFETDDRLIFVTQVDDIFRAKKEGKIGVGFHFQNSRPVEYDLRLLDVFYRLGVRVIQLTYNEKNMVGDGCTEKTNSGLSKFGVKMVERMNKIGMVVDLSHVGYRSSMEAIEVSKDPVIFSHSNAWKVSASKRNLKDDQIKALAAKKGVIGMNAFPGFVKWENPTLDDLLNHVDHIANLVGTDHFGIGFDYSQTTLASYKYWGYDPETYPLPPWVYPKNIDTIDKTPNFTQGLVSRGYSDKDIKKILGENFIRVYQQVWK
jgi:membrane dipeptidase